MNFFVTNSSDERRYFLAVLDNKQLSVTWKKACEILRVVWVWGMGSFRSSAFRHIQACIYFWNVINSLHLLYQEIHLCWDWFGFLLEKKLIKLALTPQKCFWSCFRLKCIWHKLGYPQELSNGGECCLFYCASTLGCRVIQDLDLCKLDDLWRHIVDADVKSQTMEYLWTLFLCRTETLCSCYTIYSMWPFYFNAMGSGPSAFKGWNQSFPPSRKVSCSSCSFSVGERI